MASKRPVLIALVGILIAVSVVLALSYLGKSNTNSVSYTVRLVEFSGNRFWDPSNITVTQGQTVTLVVFNGDDEDQHALAVDELSVNTGAIAPGATVRVTFVASKVGVFRFYDPLPPTATDPFRSEAGILIIRSP